MSTKKLVQAIRILEEDLSEIRTVREWAAVCGFNSPKNFSHKFIRRYDVRPKRVHVMVRKKWIYWYLFSEPDFICYRIARQVGLKDVQGLNGFMKRHREVLPSQFRLLSASQQLELFRKWEREVKKLK